MHVPEFHFLVQLRDLGQAVLSIVGTALHPPLSACMSASDILLLDLIGILLPASW